MDDVLIVGAGPTGLALALWLTKQGVRIRIIDANPGPGETSRALAVQARTLELYRQLGIADAVVAAGHKNPAVNLWARGKHQARIPLGEAGSEITPYPYVLIYPQDAHEAFLVERLRELGVEVERRTEFITFEDKGDRVLARLKGPDGAEQMCEARFIAGSDGARSPIRHQLGNQFEGGTYKQVFYVADVELTGLEPAGEVHIALDSSDFVAILSYGAGKHRLIGTIADERAERAESLTFDDVGQYALKGLGAEIRKVNWFSTYRVHHRITDRFRRGRVFLLGDAAHVHSPAGGQGMNTGIIDAINLAWKLASVLKGKASDSLLESYDLERRAFAHKLVETTDRIFTFATAQGGFADFVRTHVAPLFVSVAYRLGSVREFMFRMISQTMLSYHDSTLSEGIAGSVHGGDRLPWVPLPGADNFAPLSAITWQVHVYGSTNPDLRNWCAQRGIPLHVFAWTPEHKKVGLSEDAMYLLRPDTWVALALEEQSTMALETYFSARGIVMEPQP